MLPYSTTVGGCQFAKNALQSPHQSHKSLLKENHIDDGKKVNPALLVIDMVKDYFDPRRKLKITPHAQAIVNPIKELARAFRGNGWPVVFATDAYKQDDFIFTGGIEPESIAGTEGAHVIDELERHPGDLWLPKPRFSAFFQTGLEKYLRERAVDLCAVAGLATPVCVLATALDAICYNFKVVIVSDCSAAVSEKVHNDTLSVYRKSAMYPILKVSTAADLLSELGAYE